MPYPCDDLIDMVSDDEFKKLFFNTAQKDIAVEINACAVRDSIMKNGCVDENSALIRMFKIAKEVGCKFIFGTDAHELSYFGDSKNVENLRCTADCLGIKENDIADIAK